MVDEAEEIQPELFDQFANSSFKPKGKKHRWVKRKRLLPHFTFTFSYENVIVSVIVLFLIVIVSFSLGMEKGKRISDSGEPFFRYDAPVVEANPIGGNSPKADVSPKTEISSGAKKSKNVQMQATVSRPPLVKEEKKTSTYVIQVATFKQRKLAEKELLRVKELNYNAFYEAKGKFYLVFTGNYATRESARRDMKELRKVYKDCFIKRRQR